MPARPSAGSAGYLLWRGGHGPTRTAGLLPIGLAAGVRLTRDVAAGDPVPLDAVELNDGWLTVRLWRQQGASPRATPLAA